MTHTEDGECGQSPGGAAYNLPLTERLEVGSGAQGPEAMCVGSLPVTSEMMSATTGASDSGSHPLHAFTC